MSGKRTKQSYSTAFKMKAVNRVIEDGVPPRQVTNELGITNRDTLYRWLEKYDTYGEYALKDNRKPAYTKSNDERKWGSSDASASKEDMRMEIDALKKLLNTLNKEGK